MRSETTTQAKGNILAVDDTSANLQLLTSLLGKQGFTVRAALSGELALQASRRQAPDLVLLDARMPKMDGFETCRQLKMDERLKEIPVIFISAHSDLSDKLKAFEAGGVDYIAKPFDAEEIHSRIRLHLELQRRQNQAAQKNSQLEKIVCQRTRQLEQTTARLLHLDDLKDEFLAAISHELRTPLQGLLGAVELAFSEFPDHPQMREYQQMFEVSRRRILMFVEDALLLAHMKAKGGKFAANTSELNAILQAVCEQLQPAAAERGVQLKLDAPHLGSTLGDWFFLLRALNRLLETALKFSRRGTTVSLSASPAMQEVHLNIEAQGFAVPADMLPHFFDLLAIGQAATPGGDLGLSPAVAAHIIHLLGGTVTLTNLSPAGIRIQASLPRAPALHPAASL